MFSSFFHVFFLPPLSLSLSYLPVRLSRPVTVSLPSILGPSRCEPSSTWRLQVLGAKRLFFRRVIHLHVLFMALPNVLSAHFLWSAVNVRCLITEVFIFQLQLWKYTRTQYCSTCSGFCFFFQHLHTFVDWFNQTVEYIIRLRYRLSVTLHDGSVWHRRKKPTQRSLQSLPFCRPPRSREPVAGPGLRPCGQTSFRLCGRSGGFSERHHSLRHRFPYLQGLR